MSEEGIMPRRQHDAASSDALSAKRVGQLFCRMLTALVGIDIGSLSVSKN